MPQLLPRYTEEARRVGVQGVVILKLLLSASGDIDRIRVVRRLPYGLTESDHQGRLRNKIQAGDEEWTKGPTVGAPRVRIQHCEIIDIWTSKILSQ